jgi:hypothetical protein
MALFAAFLVRYSFVASSVVMLCLIVQLGMNLLRSTVIFTWSNVKGADHSVRAV